MNYHGEGLIKDARINGTAVIMGVPEKGIVAVKRQLRVTYAMWPAGKHNPNMGDKYLWDFTTSYDALCIAYDGRPTGLSKVDIPKWYRLLNQVAEAGNLSLIAM